MIPIIEINNLGNIETLYTDEIDLYKLGQVKNIRRASFIEFDEEEQYWMVLRADTSEVVYTNKNREESIKWEIENFQPGGRFYGNS